ncbi:MAG: hypothetical protein QW470_00360 [Candidatus Caldarchaeum sp.]
MLRCVCGNEIKEADDLEFSNVADGVFKARCKNRFCRLEEVLEIFLTDKKAEVRFSAMFSDYNLLTMGSDVLEKRLKDFGNRIVERVAGRKGLKTRVTHR